jgi:LuxR family maltose regulon positive regulatory protein
MSGDETITLIRTKLGQPKISDDLVTRPRLIDYLKHDPKRNFTLISAPAGYGKTTLLVQWLNEIDKPVAWLALDKHDSDLARFLNYLLAAVRTLYPQGVERTHALLQVPILPPPEVIAAMFINDISTLGEAFVLVLDDFHSIEDETISDVIDRLINHLPQNLHLVIVTRQDPPLPLPKLRASWTMKEVRSDALRFTRQETESFLSTMGIEELTADDMAVLDKRMEGWITGLRLAALTLRNTADRESFIQRFQVTVDSFSAEYLAAEVLAAQEPEVQEFLLCTSILDRFCAPLCEAIVETVNGRIMLEELQRANLFVISLDQEGKWYRYHHLFQDLLQHRLHDSRDMTEIQALHSHASAWLASRDLIDEALRHALAAGDVASAARMVKERRITLLNKENWRPLHRWLDQLPREVAAASPALTLTRAWIAVYHFDPVALHSLLERAERILNERLKELPPNEAMALQGEIDALYSYFLQTFDSKPELSLSRAEHALDRLPKEFAIARGLAQDFKAVALQVSGRLDEAIRLLERLIGDPLQLKGVKTQAYIALCLVHFGAGDLNALANTASQYVSYTSDLKALPSFAWASYFAGQVAYELNELQQAIEYLSVVADLEKYAVFVTYHNSILLLAKTYWALARKAEAQEIIRLHEQKVGESGNPAFILQVDALKAQFALDIADLDGATRWAQQADPIMFVEPMFIDENVSPYWVQILTESADKIGLKAVQSFLEQRLGLYPV